MVRELRKQLGQVVWKIRFINNHISFGEHFSEFLGFLGSRHCQKSVVFLMHFLADVLVREADRMTGWLFVRRVGSGWEIGSEESLFDEGVPRLGGR